MWQLSTDVGKDKAIRQSVAQIIDRQAISDNAYDGTVTPSYSIVPPGFGGQKDAFMEKYGEPNVDAAKQILDAAGVKTPVKIKLGYPPEHYGPNTVDEATELADQLNSSGLFDATTADAAWEEYQTITKEGLTTSSSSAGTPTSWTPTTTCRRSSVTVGSSPTTTPTKRSTSSSTRRSARPTRPFATSRSASCRTSSPTTFR